MESVCRHVGLQSMAKTKGLGPRRTMHADDASYGP